MQALGRQYVYYVKVLGRSYFKDKIEEMTNRQTRLGQPGRPGAEEEEGTYLIGF